MRRAALLLAAALAACGKTEPIVVRDVWIREAPPGATVHAGYLTLENRGRTEQVLEGTNSAAFARVELHEMSMQDGNMRMRKLDRLTVPAGASVKLEPGGMHLMLFGAKRPVTAGQRLPVDLGFGDLNLAVEAEVRRKD